MQQMISLVPIQVPQVGQMPLQGSGQTGGQQQAPGLFQAILLEALGGLPLPAGEGAMPVPAGPPTSGPVPAIGMVQVPANGSPAGVTAPTEASPPSTGTNKVPIRLTGSPPLFPTVAPDAAPATADAPGDEPAPDADAPTPAAMADPLPALAAQAAMNLVQPAPQPTPVSETPPTPAAQPALALAAAETPVSPELERFVQKAAQSLQAEPPVVPVTEAPSPTESQPTPTFRDLVQLVVEAEKGQTPAHPQAEAKTLSGTPAAPLAAAKVAKAEETTETAIGVATHPPAARETGFAETAAPAPEAPRQPDVEPEQVLRQVTRFVKVMIDSRQSEVRLQLHPEHLGSIAVKLVVGDGAVRANLVAQDVAVKAALEANLDQLRNRLADQGLQVEQVHVSVGGDGSFSNPQHSRQGEHRQPQQPWRQQGWRSANEDPGPQEHHQRQATWSVRGTGARLNSLA